MFSNEVSRARESRSASFAEGLNAFFSIDMIVWRVVPTRFASCSWERPFDNLISLKLFFN